ncbi:MAG: hypothetical protein A2504_12905 [Bdellovibrionales bacterium RIFOXYD12_FULL_39_22]|nr:MAG: hypothetical protein A2385_11960 [Bdellovibrionales bacterium RIFOXYB1_FULL_39_21]OFZ48939.1 MAG: hypothetical protein A2404_14170 [Bdellovibrionales bacterium RIFOXYC1_FULL_39_130]OFZ77639.1 MAG: hypothetical protein A2560_04750 [Bdellovibrionales bacterium RIFOXYD1_FULL_39_84]OFZ96093.1 MAG: hypothetical protein A2504_12905 [Bdellovibrionales bacterium RIFOXYD12_FULL_39_22]HLE11632.1 ABC transporter ATP-binding protein [Bacteriovoracaceae bacterium]
MKKFSTLKRVYTFFNGYKRSLLIALFLVILSTAIAMAMPLIFRHLLDQAIPSKDLSQIITIGILFLLATVASSLCSYSEQLLVGNMGFEIINQLKIKLLKHILTLPLNFFDKNGAGRLISRIDSDTQQLFMLFSSVSLELLGAALNVVVAIIIMFSISSKYALMAIPMIPFFIFFSVLFFGRLRKMYKHDRKLYANISAFLGEHLGAIPLLQKLAALEWSKKKFQQVNDEKTKFAQTIFLREYAIFFAFRIIPELIIALVIYRGASDIKANVISIGTIWMFIDYLRMATEPLFRLSEQIGQLQRGVSSADRLFEILDTRPEVDNEKNITPHSYQSYNSYQHQPYQFKEKIEFKNVSFAHTPTRPTLTDLSFSINKNEIVAIVGPTGHGKSTIFSLLCRFYNVDAGEILIDGKNLQEIHLSSWRKIVGLFWQEIKLFPGNVLDNLKVLRQDIPDCQVHQITSDLGITSIIENFEKGFATSLLENGGNISSGEKQLLSLARSMVFGPDILLLDEATSAIDPQTEQMIQAALDKILPGKTAIIIAHRLSTIARADKIIVIKDGKVVEQGTHHELMTANADYANLYHSQNHRKEVICSF